MSQVKHDDDTQSKSDPRGSAWRDDPTTSRSRKWGLGGGGMTGVGGGLLVMTGDTQPSVLGAVDTGRTDANVSE